ncbi:hypothetical protein [Acidisphaera sp. S103]|uniref:hypothetical protein n=1 Tax=Acidisphaera sp. S103 TaxID=1747223 RepID=UPI00131C353D|nr:hypothetical protein [Acidisphaera sp. S103]
MQIEMLPGTDNVIRFPVDMREKPSMRLLHQLRPDVRVLFMQAEGLGFELPQHGLCDCTDQATAEHIAGQLDADGRATKRFLDELLEPLLQRAVEAARKAVVAAASAQAARKAVVAAASAQAARRGAASVHAPDALKERAFEMTEQAVRLGLEAHGLCEETIGVERAVCYARKGEPWVLRNQEADMDILIAAKLARRSRR